MSHCRTMTCAGSVRFFYLHLIHSNHRLNFDHFWYSMTDIDKRIVWDENYMKYNSSPCVLSKQKKATVPLREENK